MSKQFNAASFLGRMVFALALVLGTYNPSDYSYFSWILSGNTSFGPVSALIGVVLLIAWIVYLRATFLSLGWASSSARRCSAAWSGCWWMSAG